MRSPVEAEDLVPRYHREHGLNAVVLCPSTTFGGQDHGPSAAARLIKASAAGKVPFYVRNQRLEVVDVNVAAHALLLAEERDRAGERYITAKCMMSSQEIISAAAEGHKPPRAGIPLSATKLAGVLGETNRAILKRDATLTTVFVRLMHCMPAKDHRKAQRARRDTAPDRARHPRAPRLR